MNDKIHTLKKVAVDFDIPIQVVNKVAHDHPELVKDEEVLNFGTIKAIDNDNLSEFIEHCYDYIQKVFKGNPEQYKDEEQYELPIFDKR